MWHFIAVVLGIVLVVGSFVDLINTLVSTSTSWNRWWPSVVVTRWTFGIVRRIALRLDEDSRMRESMLAVYGPFSLLLLLFCWVVLQVVGFGLIWYGLGDTPGVDTMGEAIYYSGVVFFTVGFGEIVPVSTVPRIGVLFEALSGVAVIALTVGYLPTLYSAYSDRERMLMTLDDGNLDRITPTDLVIAWAPDADPERLDEQFEKWELWAAGILETQSAVPLLMFFRSHDRRQNWVTALGLLCDAAMHAQFIKGASDGSAYWFLRRATSIFEAMTPGVDLSTYVTEYDRPLEDSPARELFKDLYRRLDEHGFELHDFDEIARYSRVIRREWAPRMEYLIDYLVAPRGFWAPPVNMIRLADWRMSQSIDASTSPHAQQSGTDEF